MQSIPNSWIKKANQFANDHEYMTTACRTEASALKAVKFAAADAREAREILQAVAQTVQQTAHKKIASVVTRCLEAVFPDHYEFKIHFERKRGKTEARLVFVKGESEIDPLDAAGGGVVDVAAFALRVASLMLSQPPLRRVIIMDEPFKYVSADFRPAIRGLLEMLSRDLGIQFIQVTHITELETGKIIEVLGTNGGNSKQRTEYKRPAILATFDGKNYYEP